MKKNNQQQYLKKQKQDLEQNVKPISQSFFVPPHPHIFH